MSKTLTPAMIISALVRPLVRFCLKRGVRVREIEELTRQALVEEARAAIEEARGEVSVSKISVITGIHRVEVARVLAGERRPKEKHDVLNRVVGLWSQRKSYRGTNGEPKPLTYQGTSSEFADLVASISKEVSHYPLLFELERIGAIRYEGERVVLQVVEYTPHGDVEHGLRVLGEDVEDLLNTVESNLTSQERKPTLHLRTAYDNIDPSNLPQIRRWVLERGATFQKEVREYLSSLDRDVNPTLPAGPQRAKVSVSVFSHRQTLEEAKELKPKKRGRKPCAPQTKD